MNAVATTFRMPQTEIYGEGGAMVNGEDNIETPSRRKVLLVNVAKMASRMPREHQHERGRLISALSRRGARVRRLTFAAHAYVHARSVRASRARLHVRAAVLRVAVTVRRNVILRTSGGTRVATSGECSAPVSFALSPSRPAASARPSGSACPPRPWSPAVVVRRYMILTPKRALI